MNKHRLIHSTQVWGFLLVCSLIFSGCYRSGSELNMLGNQAFEMKEFKKALRLYQNTQALLPESSIPRYNAANVYYRQGAYSQAIQSYLISLKTATEVQYEKINYNLGNAYFFASQYDLAISAYKEVLKSNPDNDDAKFNLELSLSMKQLQEDIEEFEEENQKQEVQDKEYTESTLDEQSGKDSNSSTDENEISNSESDLEIIEGMNEELARRLLEAASQSAGNVPVELDDSREISTDSGQKDW